MFDLNGLVWPRMVFLLLFMAIKMFELVWPCLVLYGLFMALYSLLRQNIVFSCGHRSKFIWSCLFCILFQNYFWKSLWNSEYFFQIDRFSRKRLLQISHLYEAEKIHCCIRSFRVLDV